MRAPALLALALIGGLSACQSIPAVSQPISGKIVIAGDSTAADYAPVRAPQTGWGQALPHFLSDPSAIDNRAVNGRSTRSYLDEGKWDALLETLNSGDTVLISFGHNDSRDDSEERFADARTTYPQLLRKFITDVRDAGAIPVIVSSAPRRLWEGPAMVETHGLYRESAETVARETGTEFVDLSNLGLAYFEAIGRNDTKQDFLWLTKENTNSTFPNGVEDNTHFTQLGACGMAYIIASALEETDAFAPLINKDSLDSDKTGRRPGPVIDCFDELTTSRTRLTP